ncbi:ribbon-helix-helix domain-containing protein [Rhizobium sp. CECT 9324]|uniref:ribbon-helix-helix domain-containing protein n=1 Tax=Rhizobium sp. CECT 9324 TaxID=2845820 RepID=UPI001E51550B|nr:ribbon-helix-helix domain-containing protein [Rhizobium sp. CECT 9324]CAH0342860.1 hypothetical protein RHI9324_04592 [Rhizobium sp. CECT 9324]
MLIAKPEAVANLGPSGLESSVIPALGQEDIEPHFRAVTGRAGERRGIRLERIYWDGLHRMSAASKLSTAELVNITAAQFPDGTNVTSLMRVVSLKWAMVRMNMLERVSSLDNLHALIQACPSPALVLTRTKRIQMFNDAFLTVLRQKLPVAEAVQLAASLRFSIDVQVEEAISTLEGNKGKTLSTSFTVAFGSQSIRGTMNLAIAPAHDRQMLIGYISRY